MKPASEPIKALFEIVDREGVPGLPATFRIGSSAAATELRKLAEKADTERAASCAVRG